MTPLEEKITKAIDDIFGNNDKAYLQKEMVIEYTVANFKQAIEEERQRILELLPKPIECPTQEYESAIGEVRNIISKPNI